MYRSVGYWIDSTGRHMYMQLIPSFRSVKYMHKRSQFFLPWSRTCLVRSNQPVRVHSLQVQRGRNQLYIFGYHLKELSTKAMQTIQPGAASRRYKCTRLARLLRSRLVLGRDENIWPNSCMYRSTGCWIDSMGRYIYMKLIPLISSVKYTH